MRKNISTNEEGVLPLQLPMNLCNIYQFATDIVTTNTTMRSNTCSFDNKRCKTSELRFIANPPLSRIRQSATTKHKNAPHQYEGCVKTSCSFASSKFYVSASTFQPQTTSTVSCLSLPQLIPKGHVCHKWHHCSWWIPGLFMGPTVGLFGFLAWVNT